MPRGGQFSAAVDTVHRTRRLLAGADQTAYTRELETWMRGHSVNSVEVAAARGECKPGALVWCETPFTWSPVAQERQAAHAGMRDVRSTFSGAVLTEQGAMRVHGTFNPLRLTCSTAGSELRGVRRQFVLGQVAEVTDRNVELRPLVIATRLLDVAGEWPMTWGRADDGQRIPPEEVDQFAGVDFAVANAEEALQFMSSVPEARVKTALASILVEPVVPKDWGGEQSDLWTTRLRVNGSTLTAAFLLKGPAGGAYARPMTIAMLGKNGDQLQRLAASPAEVLVLQHCHHIRPEVLDMLRSLASDFRRVRRYLVLDGFDSYAVLRHAGFDVLSRSRDTHR